MKKITLVILWITLNSSSFGQITTTKVASTAEMDKVISYDSTENYLGKNYYGYVGQELYLNGKPEDLRKSGYYGFLIDYNKSVYTGGIYKSVYSDRIYKCCDEYNNSKYEELAGKYFSVLEIIRYPKEFEKYEILNVGKVYLKLKEKESNDIIYFEYNYDSEYSFPFIVVGFYEKLKQKSIGQKFVFGDTNSRFGDEELDIKTNKKINFELGEEWECFDVTVEEKYFNLSLLLKDDDGQTLAMNYEWVIGANKLHDIYAKKEADKYKNRFGLNMWHTILQGKVKLGMTKEMCKLSWGEPKEINQTITSGKKSEQWVYRDNYLYFDNGVLTAIQ